MLTAAELESKAWLLGAVLASVAFAPGTARAADYYVSPTGNDASPGSLSQPLATLQKAAGLAQAGDTVWLRGGIYRIVEPATPAAGIHITKSGTSDTQRIRFFAYEGEVPIFDFADLRIATGGGYTSGFVISGSWLHFKGLEIRNVPMNTRSNSGISVTEPAHDNVFELLNIHHISGTGLFFSHGTGGHLVLNSDSHDNYDPTSHQGDGQNADGFGVHYQETGAVTVFRGCRAWWNSDDGWDLISQEVPVIIENSWAFGNGYIDSGAGRPADGNGNGFKAGSSKTGIRHVIRHNIAWGNRASGFYANHSSGGNDWFNNTSYDNGTQYNLWASTWDAAGNRTDGVILTGDRAHKMRNNVAFPNKNSYIDGYGVDTAFNTWDLELTPNEADFVGISDAGFMGPRQPDGSLPDLDFLKLREGSRLVDRGTDVGLAYVGEAPDLGAHELGATGPGAAGSATGGSSGTAGANTAGTVGNGGAAGNASEPGTGGSSASGTAGAATGGSLTAGSPSSPSGGAGRGDLDASPVGAADAGCNCRLAPSDASPPRTAPFIVLGFALAALARRRRL